jgi:hypothetical protein
MSSQDIWVVDPFKQNQDNSKLIDPYEVYTVQQYTVFGSNWYGIQLKGAPVSKFLPSEVNPGPTPRKVRIVKDDDPGFIYDEVARTTVPGSINFRVDYDNRLPDGSLLQNYQTTGLIQFSETELGQVVRVNYYSSGLSLLPQNYADFLTDGIIPGSLTIQDDLTVGGKLHASAFETHINLASGETVLEGDFVSIFNESPGVLKGKKGAGGIQSNGSDTFNDTSISLTSSRTMIDGNVVTAYKDGTTGFGEITIRSADDLTVVVAPLVFKNSTIQDLDICILDSGDIVVIYSVAAGQSFITTRSKTDLTEVVAPLQYSAVPEFARIQTLQDGDIVLVYNNKIEERSKTDLTLQTGPLSYGTGTGIIQKDIAIMNDGNIVIAYNDPSTNGDITIRSKTDLTEVVAPVSFSSVFTTNMKVAILLTGDIALFYDNFLEIRSKSTLGKIGNTETITNAGSASIDLIVDNAGLIYLFYPDFNNSNNGTIQQRSPDTIDKVNHELVFESSTTTAISVNLLADGKFTINYNASSVGNINKYVGLINLGYANEDGDDTNPVKITFAPVLPLFTGLEVGENYYINSDGDTVLTPSELFAGPSISTTEIVNKVGTQPQDDFGELRSDVDGLQGEYTFESNTFLAYGAVDTVIVRMANIVKNTGDGVAYNFASSANNGDTWTFLKKGRLRMSVAINSPGSAGGTAGISRNSTQLTTNILSGGFIAADNIANAVSPTVAGSSGTPCATANIIVEIGDVIRIHTGGAIPSNAGFCRKTFTFTEI